ncbi:alpha-L-rhamnosidase [Microdochium nivale]|nr:alpha-L-rhamnosidase [Microdochium nivale]
MAATSINPRIEGLRLEHYPATHQLGTHVLRPRLSWKIAGVPENFVQHEYEVEISHDDGDDTTGRGSSAASEPSPPSLCSIKLTSSQSVLVPWPTSAPDLASRARVRVRVRAWGRSSSGSSNSSVASPPSDSVEIPWSEPISIEAGLLERQEWQAQLVSSPWEYPKDSPQPEELFRREFTLDSTTSPESKKVKTARLYITAQGVYEAEINGRVVGDHFLAPGWTEYRRRLRYQCFDVSEHIQQQQQGRTNFIGVRLAEGWFCGRLGFDGGERCHFGERPALLAQLEIAYDDGSRQLVVTDDSWEVTKGPTLKTEIYDGEKYDSRLEINRWSGGPPADQRGQEIKSSTTQVEHQPKWEKVASKGALPDTVALIAEEAEPVRRIETIQPIKQITTPSGKVVLDFGQNLVGYTRIKNVKGPRGHTIILSHAEVLENGELGTRPLRLAENRDEYTFRGDSPAGESWEPRFTFHGYRYMQVDGWPGGDKDQDLLPFFEAVVCHTDMCKAGDFSCSNEQLNRLHENARWSMRGNFLSIPTDCPQRDERLGWTGDIAMFSPTASLLYGCTNIIRGWLRDLAVEQAKHGGIPPMVVPNVLQNHFIFGSVRPAAVWGDAAVLTPWALYQATGDADILREQYQSMLDWVAAIPRNKTGNTHLWDATCGQLGDWLDPSAPPENPAGGKCDAVLVADAFLIQTLDIVSRTAAALGGREVDAARFQAEAAAARTEFVHEYMTAAGRLMSDSQTAYALAIVFDLYPSAEQRRHGCDRLVRIVRRNAFKIGTGFAGTPYICEALTLAGRADVAYAMLYNEECPGWLYSVKMGATTIWERYDSMLPDGSVNPGEMTSFNHYALGSVARWMWERAAGLRAAEPGWTRLRVCPVVGGDLTSASARHETPFGSAASSWALSPTEGGKCKGKELELVLTVVVPPNTTAEIVFPEGPSSREQSTVMEVGSGTHEFRVVIDKPSWPVEPIGMF